mmetsp:Transcript_27237/g.51403  ORF Transcript_27237/g.51403 Transcript_27237/m.51403 type:complete len:128 (+) Transcript_27237:63-446(+)
MRPANTGLVGITLSTVLVPWLLIGVLGSLEIAEEADANEAALQGADRERALDVRMASKEESGYQMLDHDLQAVVCCIIGGIVVLVITARWRQRRRLAALWELDGPFMLGEDFQDGFQNSPQTYQIMH